MSERKPGATRVGGGREAVLSAALQNFYKYGYHGTPATLASVKAHEDLRNNLSAAAHLIHGSTEGRFRVTYCPGHLTQEQIESVNFRYADLARMVAKYDPKKLKDGFNTVGGERIFYISNPALGLWSTRARFQ